MPVRIYTILPKYTTLLIALVCYRYAIALYILIIIIYYYIYYKYTVFSVYPMAVSVSIV